MPSLFKKQNGREGKGENGPMTRTQPWSVPEASCRGVWRVYLQGAGVAVLLGDVLSEERLRQPHLAAEGAGVGLGLLQTMALSIVEQVWEGKEGSTNGSMHYYKTGLYAQF